MQTARKERKKTLIQIIDTLLSFTLSDKLKYAIKASLSMALAYLIPFSQGWEQASTAATTVMLIAAMGAVGDSVMKGAMRVAGTVIGAAIGMLLIGLFPQDREVYLVVVSLVAVFFLYLARAYKGDMTVFMLSAVTLLMMFQNGEVDDVFIFGIDKTYMTIFGIMVYTFVGVFLWPVNIKDSSVENALALSHLQSQMYTLRDANEEERKTQHQKMITQEQLLGTSIIDTDSTSMAMNFSTTQWYDIVHSYKKIAELLTLLSYHDKTSYAENMSDYVSNYKNIDREIVDLLDTIPLAWSEQKEITIPKSIAYDYHLEKMETLSTLERAELSSTVSDISQLHEDLCRLAEKLNSLISPLPTLFTLTKISKPSSFLWFDMEDLKGSLITFMVFWAATILWITVNPPGGFMIVVLATALSILTTYSPLKPSLLIIIFTFSFIFATLMYIFVLPQLHYAWELGLFIFIYAFIGFYFINPMLAIFFLLGSMTLGINNTMAYNFDVFLIILFMFYAFLLLLLLFYYVPFSTKPEHLFLVLKKRFFTLSKILLDRSSNIHSNQATLMGGLREKYSMIHLLPTVKKMQLWASKIDEKYFDTIDKTLLQEFTKESETFVYLLEMMHQRDMKTMDNPLLKAFRDEKSEVNLVNLLAEYAEGKAVHEVDPIWRDEAAIVAKIEEKLKTFLRGINYNTYSEEDMVVFYESISLRRNVWLSLFTCQKIMEQIDFKTLETSRF